MKRRSVLGVLAGVSAGLLVASCGPPYAFIRVGTPNPWMGVRAVSLDPVHFENVLVGDKPEALWLSEKSAEQQASYMADRQGFADRFAAQLQLQGQSPVGVVLGPPTDPSMLVLRPVMLHYEPGVFTYFFNRNTEVDMSLQTVRSDGAVLEEVRFHMVVQPSMFNAASGTRMRIAGEQFGSFVNTYLSNRLQNIAYRSHVHHQG